MRHRNRTDGASRYAAALLEGILWAVPFLLLTAGMVSIYGRLPAAVLRAPGVIGWGLGAFAAGRRAGLKGRHHGLASGALCGGLLWLLRCGGGLLTGGDPAFGVLLWMLFAGAAGGLIGVNTRVKS